MGERSWRMDCGFYADNDGNIFENGVTLSLEDITFIVEAEGFSRSFKAMDVVSIDSARKADAISFVKQGSGRFKYLNPLSSLFVKGVSVIELDQRKMLFFDFKASEFRQILSVAKAKQKYSLNVAGRNR